MVKFRDPAMTEQLTADDWIKEGLKALAKNGFTALKADPLANVCDRFSAIRGSASYRIWIFWSAPARRPPWAD